MEIESFSQSTLSQVINALTSSRRSKEIDKKVSVESNEDCDLGICVTITIASNESELVFNTWVGDEGWVLLNHESGEVPDVFETVEDMASRVIETSIIFIGMCKALHPAS